MDKKTKKLTVVLAEIEHYVDNTYKIECNLCCKSWLCDDEMNSINNVVEHMKDIHKIDYRYRFLEMKVSNRI